MTTTINVILFKKNHFYSKYSNDKLRKELTDYIYDECYGENYKNHIVINIDCREKVTDDEKHRMMDIIRRTYGLRVQDEMYYAEKEHNKKTILLLIGIAFIILYYVWMASIFREIILIIGWLAIWEAVYGLVFNSHQDFMRITRLKELSKARIYFVESEQESKS